MGLTRDKTVLRGIYLVKYYVPERLDNKKHGYWEKNLKNRKKRIHTIIIFLEAQEYRFWVLGRGALYISEDIHIFPYLLRLERCRGGAEPQ